MLTTIDDTLHNQTTIPIKEALERQYLDFLTTAPLDYLLDEAMRVHSDKELSQKYGKIIREEIEKY